MAFKEYFIYTFDDTSLAASSAEETIGIAESTTVRFDSDADFELMKRTHIATDLHPDEEAARVVALAVDATPVTGFTSGIVIKGRKIISLSTIRNVKYPPLLTASRSEVFRVTAIALSI